MTEYTAEMTHYSAWLDHVSTRKLVEFLFPLQDPSEPILIVSDLATCHDHPLTHNAFKAINAPYLLLRGATSIAAVPDHALIHKNIKSLTKNNQKVRRIIAWRQAKKELSRNQFLKWRVPAYKKDWLHQDLVQ